MLKEVITRYALGSNKQEEVANAVHQIDSAVQTGQALLIIKKGAPWFWLGVLCFMLGPRSVV